MDNDFSLSKFNFYESGAHKTSKIYLLIGDDDALSEKIIFDICQTIAPQTRLINVFSPVEYKKNYFEAFIPQSCIFKQFSLKAVLRFFEEQRSLMNKCLDTVRPCDQERYGQRIRKSMGSLLILDRCQSGDKDKWIKDSDLQSAILASRDLNVNIIIRVLQRVGEIPRNAIQMYDYCFIVNMSSNGEQKHLFKEVAGMAETYAQFQALYKETVNRNTCLVIDRRREISSNTNLDDIDDDDDDDLSWTRQFCKYVPIGQALNRRIERLGIPELWQHNLFNTKNKFQKYGNSRSAPGRTLNLDDEDSILEDRRLANKHERDESAEKNSAKKNHVLSLEDLILSLPPDRKLRIQIVPSS